MAEGEFVRWLGELGYGRDSGRVGVLDLLACAGFPLSEGVMLTRRAHEEFLQTSGALQDIRAAVRREDARRRAAEIRSRRASYPVEGGLNQEICEALIGLHARAVVVISEDLEKGGLRSIPEVKDAIREAWLSLRGLEGQIEAAARGDDIPTWPVLVQRELRPRYTVLSTTRDDDTPTRLRQRAVGYEGDGRASWQVREEVENMNLPPKKILLATDGSEDARLAARAAASLSGKIGAELHVVHAWQYVPHPVLEPEHYEEEAGRLLREQAGLVADAGAPVTEAHLAMAPPVDAILDLGEEIAADLIVVGSEGHGPIGRLLLGSVSEGVVHHATRPVLVVRGRQDSWPPERVVIGDDGSEAAKKAGELAASIGDLFGTRDVLVRAYPELPETDLAGRRFDPRMVDDALHRAEQELHERAEELGRLVGRRPRIEIAAGDAAVALLEEARDGDEARALIAVGSRGLGLARRLRLGSVSTKVLRAADGPVLVFPHVM